MTPWAPVSLALLFDLRVRPLSWAERGVLHHIHLIAAASPDGITAAIEKRTGEADAAAWKRALGEDGASHLGRLVEAGWFTICPEGVRLAARSASTAPPSRVEAPAEAPPSTGKPSDGPEAQRARTDRALFKARAKGFWADIHPDTTWEAWIASPDGVAFVASRESKFPGYALRVTPLGNAGNAPRVTRVTPPGNAPPLSPQTPLSSPKNKKNEEGEGNAHAQGNAPRVTPPGNAPPPSILSGLQTAAKRATLTGALAMEREASETLDRFIPPITADEIKAMGAALANPSAWWPPGKKSAPKHVTLRDLAGWRGGDGAHDWMPLVALVAHVRTEDGDGYINRPDPPRPPQIIKIMQGEEIDRALLAAETTGPLASFLRNRKRAPVQGG